MDFDFVPIDDLPDISGGLVLDPNGYDAPNTTWQVYWPYSGAEAETLSSDSDGAFAICDFDWVF